MYVNVSILDRYVFSGNKFCWLTLTPHFEQGFACVAKFKRAPSEKKYE